MAKRVFYAISSAWIRPAPDARPDRQMLFGDTFSVEGIKHGWARGRAEKDGYQGFVRSKDLAPNPAMEDDAYDLQRLKVRSSWGYAEPDLKSEPLVDLHMTSQMMVTKTQGDWLEFAFGDRKAFVPKLHCTTSERLFECPVEAARSFLGVPYVWAGNTGFGLDCSGLIQVAMRACGQPVMADSHEQETMTKGQNIAEYDAVQAGDLIFWKGHVAMATSATHMIHANAHHMMVVEEPIDAAISRISQTDTGAVTSRLRPVF